MRAALQSAIGHIKRWVTPQPKARGSGAWQEVAGVEGAVEGALSPVRTPAPFRRDLSANLSLAAQRRAAGLTVERAPAPRTGWTFGISGGLLVAMVVMLIVALWPRAER